MQELYDSQYILEILKVFKVNEIVISGIKDENLINDILNYAGKVTQINTNDINCIKGDPLKIISNLENYDAIFISDDANWYTVFNQLQIIKKTNDKFPLVFICNNNFPNKRRDSYINPDEIPASFRHNYTNQFPICYNNEKIIVNDGLYHACDENTPKNGVLTAIEDFLDENDNIGILNVNLIKEISILYLKSQINQKRISIINKVLNEKTIDVNLSDKLIENQILISYINRYNLFDENFNSFEVDESKKDNLIKNYENTIRNQNNVVNLKDAQINGFESKLSLKDSQIKNIESKLLNRNKRIKKLEKQLQSANEDVYSMNQKLNEKDVKINEMTDEFKLKEFNLNAKIDSDENKLKLKEETLKNVEQEHVKQINEKNAEINFLKKDLSQKESNFAKREVEFNKQINSKNEDIKLKDIQLKIKDDELDSKRARLNSIEHSYTKQLSKIDNKEYCINCFKEEISNNQLEIKYLKGNSFTKRILNPIAYLYLILKSNPGEIFLNLKLYHAIKDSKCFDIGFYLNNNEDLIQSKWCKYFSPELHYVCNGFSEQRKFNKKYFNRNSKKELLDYILGCDK